MHSDWGSGKGFGIGAPAAALLLALVLAACGTVGGGGRGAGGGTGSPSVSVRDQPLNGATVTVAQVISPGPGWIAIYSDRSGLPGALLGYTHLSGGDNRNVAVTIDPARATGMLHAMLLLDSGSYGLFEFPGPDAPVSIDGKVVAPAFRVLR